MLLTSYVRIFRYYIPKPSLMKFKHKAHLWNFEDTLPLSRLYTRIFAALKIKHEAEDTTRN